MDVSIASLWLPIVVSAVALFFASAIFWMALPHHKADIRPLPDEAALTGKLSELSLPKGLYMWPNCADHKDMKGEAFKKRFADGPWGTLTVSGKPNFGANLFLTFVFYAVVSVCVGYITGQSRVAGAPGMEVFQVSATTALMAMALGQFPGAFFLGKPKRFILTDLFDAFVFALVCGGVFTLMWPAAAAG